MNNILREMMSLHSRWINKEITDEEFITSYFPISQKQIMQVQERVDKTNERLDRTDEKTEELFQTLEETQVELDVAYGFMKSKGIYDEYQFFIKRQIDEIADEILSRRVH